MAVKKKKYQIMHILELEMGGIRNTKKLGKSISLFYRKSFDQCAEPAISDGFAIFSKNNHLKIITLENMSSPSLFPHNHCCSFHNYCI